MKNKVIILFFIILLSGITACVLQPRIQYYPFPEDIAEEAKTENFKKIEKGRILYNINCASCHNTKSKRRIIIPDFTLEQLESYTIRIKNETHVAKLPENRVTADELEAIQFFFTYKIPRQPLIQN